MGEHEHRTDERTITDDVQYSFDALAYNLTTGVYVIPFSLLVMVIAQWSATEWSDMLTQIYFYVFLAMVIFSILFPHTRMAKRKVTFHSDKLMIGRRIIELGKIQRIVIEKNGSILALTVDKINEPVKIKLENKFESGLKPFLIKWCTESKISLAERK